jgi:hypothetical protein
MAMIEAGQNVLILKRASASRSSGEWSDDDYDVLAEGAVVGRIFKVNAAPVGSPWMWTLAFGQHKDRAPTHGYAATREGAIFRRIFNKRAQRITDRRLAPRNVAAIVKQGAARLGFDPSTFGGHSLRAGFVTSAVKRGANLIKITDVTGHRSLEMLKTYSRDAEAFVGHAGAGLL